MALGFAEKEGISQTFVLLLYKRIHVAGSDST